VLRFLVYGFKILQFTVFIGSCYFHGDGSLLSFGRSPWSLGLGLALIAGGQTLNLSVFYRLGKVGVFYGDRFDHQVPWCRGFPSHCSNIRNVPALCSPSEVSFSSWAFPT